MPVDRQAHAHRDHAAWINSARASVGQDSAFNNKDRFEWSQFPGCGPAADVFGVLTDQRVLELGCGTGANAAVLTRCGAVVHGVDVAVENIIQARMQFAELQPRLTFTSCSAEDFLVTTDQRFDCAYSVFGAVSFVDPHVLLPLVRRRLTPHGRLIFSVRHPECDGGGPPPQDGRVIQHRLPTTGAVVRRFEFGRTAWLGVLSSYGLQIDQMLDIPAPAQHSRGARTRVVGTPCCLLVASTAMNTLDVSRCSSSSRYPPLVTDERQAASPKAMPGELPGPSPAARGWGRKKPSGAAVRASATE